MAARLPVEVGPDSSHRVRTWTGFYQAPAELESDLKTLESSLVEAGAAAVYAAVVARADRGSHDDR